MNSKNWVSLGIVSFMLFTSACSEGGTITLGNGSISDDTSDPDEPDDPKTPADPSKPNKPGGSAEPTDPAEPTEPTDPAEPTEPTDPAEPTDPSVPTDPSEPGDPTEPGVTLPVADILDVEFQKDASAKNIAPSGLVVQKVNNNALVTYFSPEFEHYVAYFSNALSGNADAYYRVDYGASPDVMKEIQDGHSLEAVFRLDAANNGKEAKFFASHEGGGTGFLISDKDKNQEITFLIHVNGAYVWCRSGITPVVGEYYHVVGVWDKSAGNAKIYVNGELKNTVEAAGDFKFGSETWFGIGADAGSSGGQAWNGDVAVARVYSQSLAAEDVVKLFENSRTTETTPLSVSDVDAMGTCEVSIGYKYYIYGSEFKAGDVVRFESLSSNSSFTAATTLDGDHLTAVIPDGMITDRYRSVLVRGNASFPLENGVLTISDYAPKATRVRCYAHTGYFYEIEKQTENSIASLKAAQDLDVYGVELDIRDSSDNVQFVYHDAKVGGYEIAKTPAATLDKVKLSNGEKLPRLSEFLDVAKQKPTVRLLIETKWLSPAPSEKMIKSAYELVKQKDMVHQVEWLTDDINNTSLLRRLVDDPSVPVWHMGKEEAKKLHDKNLQMDYSSANLTDTHIKEAHELGMKVGVWTVNLSDSDSRCPDNRSCLRYWMNKGVDAITTNASRAMMKMMKVYAEK